MVRGIIKMDRQEKFAYELDTEMGKLAGSIEVLDDINQELMNIRGTMDDIAHRKENPTLYFHEIHRTTRILSELLHHTVKNMNNNYESSRKIVDDMFEEETHSQGELA